MLARIAWASVILSLSVRRMTPVRDEKVLALLDRCRDELGVRRRLEVLTSPAIGAPALMGFVRPRLLLPPTVLENFDAGELRLILLHELAHLKRHDVAINWLTSILQSVHWFNPIIWIAFARLRNDRELAADELVLALTGEEQRAHYGDTLVKLLQTLSRRPALSGTVGILERAHPMRRRITMIAQFHRNAPRWTLAAAACLLILAALGLTDRVRGDTPTGSAAATTKPSPGDAEREAMLHQLRNVGHPLSPQEIEQGKKDLAAQISKKMLLIDSKGQPVNQKAVEETVAEQTFLLDKSIGPTMREAPAPGGVAVVSGADDQKVQELLKKKLPEVNFQAIGFSDVVDFLRDVTGSNITVNWRALEAAGIDRNAPVTARLKDITFEQALTHILRDVGGGTVKLAFAVSNASVVISTEDEFNQQRQLRTYIVTDLLQEQDKGSAEALEKLIKQQVDQSAGEIIVTAYHDRLLIKATPLQLREVDAVLAELRRKQ
jgi:hypothetical protein